MTTSVKLKWDCDADGAEASEIFDDYTALYRSIERDESRSRPRHGRLHPLCLRLPRLREFKQKLEGLLDSHRSKGKG